MTWERFQTYYFENQALGFALDYSRVNFSAEFLPSMESKMQKAFVDMDKLEGGSIANPDENRMVGHYWLRNTAICPNKELADEITATLAKIKAFTAKVHNGSVKGSKGAFKNLLVIGIGGSALGPQFVKNALGHPGRDKLAVYFFDNTDPDGIERTLSELQGQLGETLCVVISKSGSTPETRNGMIEAEHAYAAAGLDFGKHAVAVTGQGSQLDEHSKKNGWLEFFPMWDWVGGRTSELAAVGLLPAALQGLDIDDILAGARAMDELTRSKETAKNPAALLALMWYFCTDGKGSKDMVILPYKDRLELFSRYLQQLIMESLGKEKDLAGNVVNQGISVYGNKGSTDQHAYIQQLREGIPNFFAVFIEVLKDADVPAVEVGPNTASGDYLHSFLLGTREALTEKGRGSLTITVAQVDALRVGALIALFERAVGLYASLIGINAYHQPGVEAGKKAAAGVLTLKSAIYGFLKENSGKNFTVDEISEKLNVAEKKELVFKLLNHMTANQRFGIASTQTLPFYKNSYSYKTHR